MDNRVLVIERLEGNGVVVHDCNPGAGMLRQRDPECEARLGCTHRAGFRKTTTQEGWHQDL